MARVTKIAGTAEPEQWTTVDFRRDQQWSEILRGIGIDIRTGGELILQRLIQFYPEILPWDQLEDSGSQRQKSQNEVCVVCQEASSANTDILLIERTGGGEGRFVIVETKLSDNGEIHREILGQVIEYAANLASTETRETLEQKANGYWRGRPVEFGRDFELALTKAFPEDRDEIWSSAIVNLNKGRVRILIVADNLPADLRLAVTFFPPSVLLSAIEVQPHVLTAGNNDLVLTGVLSASASGADKAHAAKERFLNGIKISLAHVHLMPGGFIVSAGIDRSSTAATNPGRSFEEHLKALGAESVPGQVLAMLKETTDRTHGRVYVGRAGWLTFFWWNLPGLYVREKDASLEMQFWPFGPVGKELADKAREMFLDRFGDELQPGQGGAYLNFLPVRQDSNLEMAKARVRKLELLYDALQNLRREHDANRTPPQAPDDERG